MWLWPIVISLPMKEIKPTVRWACTLKPPHGRKEFACEWGLWFHPRPMFQPFVNYPHRQVCRCPHRSGVLAMNLSMLGFCWLGFSVPWLINLLPEHWPYIWPMVNLINVCGCYRVGVGRPKQALESEA